jgi:prevent-host-death family protein
MEEISISKFKATCLAVIERVRKTGDPMLVTRFGSPVAQIVPPPLPASAKNWLGAMEGSAQLVGDIVSPVVDSDDWEALR